MMLLVRSTALFGVLLILAIAAASFGAASADDLRQVAGFYFVSGDDTKAFASASGNSDAISTLCPTWMSLVDSQGGVSAKEDARISEYAKAHNIKIVPLIWASDPKTMHEVFSNIFNRSRLVCNIVDAMDKFSYCQGINLDFEGMYPEDRLGYTHFIIQLASKLKPKGYLLTIDVPCKTRDNLTSSWSGAFDYPEIGRYCDTVMIMTYDEHYSGGGPGPVASVQLDDDVLAYATTVMPREKILMGLPFYGYDWPKKGKAKSSRYYATTQFVKDKLVKVNWDREAKVPWYTYSDDNGNTRTCYYEDARSIAAKLEIGRKWDVGGVCMWSLGGEDPKIWDSIRHFRQR